MPEGSQPAYEIALAHFIVADDVERSRRFYTEVLGGTTIRSGKPTYVALASSFLNIRVSDVHAVYAEWSARGCRVPHATETARDRDSLLHP